MFLWYYAVFAFIRKDFTNILKTKQFIQSYLSDFLVLVQILLHKICMRVVHIISFLNFKMPASMDTRQAVGLTF